MNSNYSILTVAMLPKTLKRVLLLATFFILNGCVNVKPWERGYLARPEMAWSADSLESEIESHIYFAKEASSGGDSAAGGGCGCN